MTRQPWWPKNFYDPNVTFTPAHMVFEEGCEAMDAAWRQRIDALYESPYPDVGEDREGLLDWFVAELLKEQNDD